MPDTIKTHLDGVLSFYSDTDTGDLSFDEVRENLKIRLYPDDMPEIEGLVSYPSPPGFLTVLVRDMPNRVASIRGEDADRWNVSREGLYELALENVWKEGRLTFEPYGGEGAILRIADGQSFFTASHALLLDRYVLHQPRLGLLMSIPTRHLVAYHEIAEEGLADAVTAMIQSGAGLFSEGPGSVSPHLYWLRDGKWSNLTQIVDERLEFSPPQAFIEEVAEPLGLV